jgi:hypothetical protein
VTDLAKHRAGWCARCGRRDDLTVHHRVPISQGGSSKRANLITLCRPCHDEEHDMIPRRRCSSPPMPAKRPTVDDGKAHDLTPAEVQLERLRAVLPGRAFAIQNKQVVDVTLADHSPWYAIVMDTCGTQSGHRPPATPLQEPR